MYYPSLILLKNEGIEFEVIDKLDNWLGKLKGFKRQGIRPARFAVDKGVDYNLANEIFSMATEISKLFIMNYEIYCPHCDSDMLKSVQSIEQIPTEIKCWKCKKVFDPYDYDEYIEITFDLIQYPDPKSPKSNNVVSTRTKFRNKHADIRKTKKENLNVKTYFDSSFGQEKLKNLLFKPEWDKYDKAYERFTESFKPAVSTEEKGKALEELSCLLLSFITFFKVDPSVHTGTNQIDITVTVQPYFKYVHLPILSIINRRILCECKNENQNVPSVWIDKLFGVINKTDNCRIGILFSREQFSGDDLKYARASQIEHARNGIYILSLFKEDFEKIKSDKLDFLELIDKMLEDLEMRVSKRSS